MNKLKPCPFCGAKMDEEGVMPEKETLTRLVEKGHDYYYTEAYTGNSVYEAIAEYLITNGVRLKEGVQE